MSKLRGSSRPYSRLSRYLTWGKIGIRLVDDSGGWFSEGMTEDDGLDPVGTG